MQILGVEFDPQFLHIRWADGKSSKLDAIWLRDHCQNPESRDSRSGQRFMNVTDFPEDSTIASATIDNGKIVVVFSPEQHRSVFNAEWLRNNCYCINSQRDDRSESSKTLWHKDSTLYCLNRSD